MFVYYYYRTEKIKIGIMPIRLINIKQMITKLLPTVNFGVIPADNPTIPNAEITSIIS